MSPASGAHDAGTDTHDPASATHDPASATHDPGSATHDPGDGPDGPVTEAAGGVVLRDGPAGPEVLLVHRVRHRDWSLPKGKLDPHEPAPRAALREVEEETGVRAELGAELPSVSYPITSGTKVVRWFRMRPVAGDPARRPPDDEVDDARWMPADEAVALLTYDQDVELLRYVLDGGSAGGSR